MQSERAAPPRVSSPPVTTPINNHPPEPPAEPSPVPPATNAEPSPVPAPPAVEAPTATPSPANQCQQERTAPDQLIRSMTAAHKGDSFHLEICAAGAGALDGTDRGCDVTRFLEWECFIRRLMDSDAWKMSSPSFRLSITLPHTELPRLLHLIELGHLRDHVEVSSGEVEEVAVGATPKWKAMPKIHKAAQSAQAPKRVVQQGRRSAAAVRSDREALMNANTSVILNLSLEEDPDRESFHCLACSRTELCNACEGCQNFERQKIS
eukprot:4623459-Prymnesium_polylepis.1